MSTLKAIIWLNDINIEVSMYISLYFVYLLYGIYNMEYMLDESKISDIRKFI